MHSRVRSFLIFVSLIGICACANTPPKSVAPAYANNFVYVATLREHHFIVNGEFQSDTNSPSFRAIGILDAAGIRHSIEADLGKVSISVDSSRSHEAIDLLCKDARAQGYWIEVNKSLQ
jgi:hypothetical protein